MSKKIIIILISALVIFGVVLGIYLSLNKSRQDSNGEINSEYQGFNPFGSGEKTNNQVSINTGNEIEPGKTGTTNSRFKQITNFAIAGATFFEDTRLITNPGEESTRVIVSPNTKEGRKEIQKLLNEEVGPSPLLIVDGAFGKATTRVIGEFQILKGLTTTGQIDAETNPYFTTTVKSTGPQYEQVPSLKYVERSTGHIYQQYLDTGEINKISNSTIPGVHEVLFGNKTLSVIYRYLSGDKTITSFMATMGDPEGEFLPVDILDISLSPDKDKYFYLVKTVDSVYGAVGSFNTSGKDIFFNSSFTEWLSQFINDQKIYLTTKPSWSVEGNLYSLNKNGVLTKVFGKIAGLTTLANKEGSLVLYNTSLKTGPRLGIYNTLNNTSSDLGIFGLPEKCVWGNDSLFIYCGIPNTITGIQYPDTWYQGSVSFDDYFIKISTITKEKAAIANSLNETSIDATHLFLDNKEETLFFSNKKDSTLWSLDLR